MNKKNEPELFSVGDEVVFYHKQLGCEGGIISGINGLEVMVEVNYFLTISVPINYISHNRS